MLIICDFDGTVTSRDTNSVLAEHFAPQVFSQLEGKLANREMTIREVLEAELEGIADGYDAVISKALEVPLRAGFNAFLDSTNKDGHQVVLLSSGFKEIIVPILNHQGVLPIAKLLAHSITFTSSGAQITWRDLPNCALCGEQCKRHDVNRLREEFIGEGKQGTIYIGDGFSDRCGAESADRIFARDSLAEYLDGIGANYESWNDFFDVVRLLKQESVGVSS